MTTEVQDSLLQALDRPAIPRVWVHVGCGGWVLFELRGGFCQHCGAGPVPPGEYRKPGDLAAKAATA